MSAEKGHDVKLSDEATDAIADFVMADAELRGNEAKRNSTDEGFATNVNHDKKEHKPT